MEKIRFQWLAQMAAAAGVIVSLSFVAYELKLSRDIATAELTLSVWARTGERNLYLVNPVHVEAAISKMMRDSEDEWTAEEGVAFYRLAEHDLAVSESLFLLHEMGLTPPSEWQAQREFHKLMWQRSPGVRSLFLNPTLFRRPSYRAELDSIAAEAKAEVEAGQAPGSWAEVFEQAE